MGCPRKTCQVRIPQFSPSEFDISPIKVDKDAYKFRSIPKVLILYIHTSYTKRWRNRFFFQFSRKRLHVNYIYLTMNDGKKCCILTWFNFWRTFKELKIHLGDSEIKTHVRNVPWHRFVIRTMITLLQIFSAIPNWKHKPEKKKQVSILILKKLIVND